MERPSYETMLDRIANFENEKRYNVITFQTAENGKDLLIKTNPEFVNIVKRFSINALMNELTETFTKQGVKMNGQEDLLKIYLEKEEEYRITVDAHDIFTYETKFFENIQDILREIILLIEEKVEEFNRSEGHVLETKVHKFAFGKDYKMISPTSKEVQEEFERLKDKYSFMKNISALKPIFEKEQCDIVEYAYYTDGFLEWGETFYTYKKTK